MLLPTPVEVGRVALDLARSGELARHLLTSLGRVVQGFGLAALAALGLGVLVGLCVPLRLMAEPVIEFVRPIPPLAFLPMFLVWFGLGEASKVAFIGYTTFFPMFVAIAASVLRVDVVLLRAAASLGATRTDLVRRVMLPAALPGIVVALRVGVGLALFVIVGRRVHWRRRRPRSPDHGRTRCSSTPRRSSWGPWCWGSWARWSTRCCWSPSAACSAGAPHPERSNPCVPCSPFSSRCSR